MWIQATIRKISHQRFNNYFALNNLILVSNFSTAAGKASKKTLYQILQVPTNAPSQVIKKNFLKLAKIYHPDVYKGKDKERYEKIQQAYKTLSDKLKRIKYDQQIGLNFKKPQSYQAQFSAKTGKGGSADNKQRQSANIKYENQQKVKQEDLEQQYNKFFNKKPQTKFEQIIMHEQPEIRSMSQNERLRRHFREYYQSPQAMAKNSQQKQYDTILNDQIKQSNRMHQDQKKAQARIKQINDEKWIRKMKIRISIIFAILFAITIPNIHSYLTKYQIQKEKEKQLLDALKEIQEQLQRMEVKGRYKYVQ